MRPDHARQRLSSLVLCASLAFVTVVFGVRVKYVPGLCYALAAIQLTVLCVSAWNLGAWAIGAETEERRRLAVAGALLVRMQWLGRGATRAFVTASVVAQRILTGAWRIHSPLLRRTSSHRFCGSGAEISKS